MSAKKDRADKAEATSTNGKPSNAQDVEECFIIMPISDPDGYTQGHFQRVYEDLFVPACKQAGYHAVRADQVRQTNLIHLDVLQKIIDSPMAICDLSNRNPNVMFELGLRQAFDKPVVLVQEEGTEPIFDITPLRYTQYRKEMLYRQVIEDQETITRAIMATREAISNSKSINSIVKLLSLTHSASLTDISEADKDTAMLQVIMAEIGNLRSELRPRGVMSQSENSDVPTSTELRLSPQWQIILLQNKAEKLIKLISTEKLSQIKAAELHKEINSITSERFKLYAQLNPLDPSLINALNKLEDRVVELDSMYLNALKTVYSEAEEEMN